MHATGSLYACTRHLFVQLIVVYRCVLKFLKQLRTKINPVSAIGTLVGERVVTVVSSQGFRNQGFWDRLSVRPTRNTRRRPKQ